MIVVDTNVIAHLLFEGPLQKSVRALFLSDAEWAAPVLWRSEFRNILATCLRRKQLTATNAIRLADEAHRVLAGREFEPDSADVLRLAGQSGCTAYDCEFVAVADNLGVPLVTTDTAVLKAFPARALTLPRALGTAGPES